MLQTGDNSARLPVSAVKKPAISWLGNNSPHRYQHAKVLHECYLSIYSRLVAKRPHVACGIPQVFLYITRGNGRGVTVSFPPVSPLPSVLPLPFPFPSFLLFFPYPLLCSGFSAARCWILFRLRLDTTSGFGIFGQYFAYVHHRMKGMPAFSLVALHRFTI